MTKGPIRDWTRGEEGIAFQHCPACDEIWYFHREFCPHCGRREIDRLQSSGRGVVHTLTLVTRAPSEELRALAPYCVLLVDAAEGFRMMAHGDKDLAIGDSVQVRFLKFGSLTIPYFEKAA